MSTTESYSYDNVGNRLSSLGVPSHNYNSSNQLTSTSNGSYTHDANGNTSTDPAGRSYTWDFENRLAQAVVPGFGTVRFKYDPLGRRIAKQSLSGSKYFLYDGANVIADLNSAGTPIARYIQGAGIDEPLASSTGTNLSFYEADGLGSITSLTDGAGSLAATYTYDAFGNVVNSAGNLLNPYRYTGREWDDETGLYYYRARYYDPKVGRFLSEDPSHFTPTFQQYGYVHNDPLNRFDPTGLADVYIWRPRPGHDSFGHAALKLRSGLNISWWPSGEGRNGAKDCNKCQYGRSKGNYIYVAPAIPNQTVADAESLEERPPDIVIHLNDLDEDAIAGWWHEFTKATNIWDTVNQNCSTVVGNALGIGAHDWLFRPRPFMWTPIDVEGYARELQLRERIF